jgi:hypothetical protein
MYCLLYSYLIGCTFYGYGVKTLAASSHILIIETEIIQSITITSHTRKNTKISSMIPKGNSLLNSSPEKKICPTFHVVQFYNVVFLHYAQTLKIIKLADWTNRVSNRWATEKYWMTHPVLMASVWVGSRKEITEASLYPYIYFANFAERLPIQILYRGRCSWFFIAWQRSPFLAQQMVMPRL